VLSTLPFSMPIKAKENCTLVYILRYLVHRSAVFSVFVFTCIVGNTDLVSKSLLFSFTLRNLQKKENSAPSSSSRLSDYCAIELYGLRNLRRILSNVNV